MALFSSPQVANVLAVQLLPQRPAGAASATVAPLLLRHVAGLVGADAPQLRSLGMSGGRRWEPGSLLCI